MIRAAIGFFIVGLIAMLLGANNVAGISIELGRTLLLIFLILALVSFVAALFAGRRGGIVSILLTSLALGFAAPRLGHAHEEPGDKAVDSMGDTKTQAKKDVRTAKRQLRKATGNDNSLKDAKDHADDAKDDLKNEQEKAERKAQ